MKKLPPLFVLSSALILCGPLFGADSSPAPKPERHTAVPAPSAMESDPTGWIDLLADQTLRQWKRVAYPGKPLKATHPWTLNPAEHVLQCDGAGTVEMYLFDREFTNGVFHCEWRFRPVESGKGYNSGAFCRSSEDGTVWHQAQIGNSNVGYLFGKTKVNDQIKGFRADDNVVQLGKPPGEWNSYEIAARDNVMTLWINGAITATWTDCQVAKGLVGLEAEGWFIEFRNVKFKPAP